MSRQVDPSPLFEHGGLMSRRSAHVLIASDREDVVAALRNALANPTLTVSLQIARVASVAALWNRIVAEAVDVLLLDAGFAADGGLSILGRLRAEGVGVPAILLTD